MIRADSQITGKACNLAVWKAVKKAGWMVSKLDGPTAEEMAYIQAVRMVFYAVDKREAALVE